MHSVNLLLETQGCDATMATEPTLCASLCPLVKGVFRDSQFPLKYKKLMSRSKVGLTEASEEVVWSIPLVPEGRRVAFWVLTMVILTSVVSG